MSHGSGGRNVLAPRSRLYQGPFGRIFGNLEPWTPPGVAPDQVERHLLRIAQEEMVEAPGRTPREIADNGALRDELEREFGSAIPAGYTYFGQFIDHDITFDPASSLMRQNDPEALLNHRTPRLDLDNVYGRGPKDSPYLYDRQSSGKFLIGEIEGASLPDLPRNRQGRALIGDMRNDENSIVSQLQLVFLKAHNTLVDRAVAQGAADPFGAARQTLRWLYQHVVWNDFIRRVAKPTYADAALRLESRPGGRKAWVNGLADIYSWNDQPFMPVEFSVAAYRFGHSMVRNGYQTNQPFRGFGSFAPIFDNRGVEPDPDDLRGFRAMKALNAVQWDWFLPMTSSRGPFPQMARKIDSKLSNALTVLHEEQAGSPRNILAFLNLLRGYRFDLPSGTAVAERLGVEPVPVAPDHDALWFHILREAEARPEDGLGDVGSIIVCATFAGLLIGDPQSWLNVQPLWTPDDDPLLDGATDRIDSGRWELASIVRLSGQPVEAGDFPG